MLLTFVMVKCFHFITPFHYPNDSECLYISVHKCKSIKIIIGGKELNCTDTDAITDAKGNVVYIYMVFNELLPMFKHASMFLVDPWK